MSTQLIIIIKINEVNENISRRKKLKRLMVKLLVLYLHYFAQLGYI